MRVGIIDYGMGNLLSVKNALETVGAETFFCETAEEIQIADRLVLPGIGAFPDCMSALNLKNFAGELEQAVIQNRKPILGICLGMQAMAKVGYEGKKTEGLGWFDADVIRFEQKSSEQKIPHIGWSDVRFSKNSHLFKKIPEGAEFYFVHSFWVKCRISSDVLATVDYFGDYTAAIQKNNIVATQFHPEKSQSHGLQFLENFLSWDP